MYWFIYVKIPPTGLYIYIYGSFPWFPIQATVPLYTVTPYNVCKSGPRRMEQHAPHPTAGESMPSQRRSWSDHEVVGYCVSVYIYIYTWRWLNIYECLFIACDGTILRFPMWFHPVRTCCYCSGCWVQILPTIWLWEWYLVLKCFEWFWYSLLLSTIVAIASWATGEWQGATSRSRPVQCYIPWIQYIYIFTYCWLHVTYNIFRSCFLNCFQEPRPA